MHKALFIIPAFSLIAGTALAANSNAPIIIDANATAAYVNDGSSTNRMSPPVPGIPPLRSLRAAPDFASLKNVTTAETPAQQQQAKPIIVQREPRTADEIAEANPNASYRFIDKRPLGMNIAPVANKSVYTLDDVPKDQQRKPAPETLSPAR